jgi:flagellar basal-body rod protein FlgC
MSLDLLPAGKITSSALQAERIRMDTIANNLANVNSTSSDASGVYKRKVAVFESLFKDAMDSESVNELDGVKVTEVVSEDKNPLMVYAPHHPHADKKTGMLAMPNISPMDEMVDMITATRAYEANLSVMKDGKQMAEKTIEVLRN